MSNNDEYNIDRKKNGPLTHFVENRKKLIERKKRKISTTSNTKGQLTPAGASKEINNDNQQQEKVIFNSREIKERKLKKPKIKQVGNLLEGLYYEMVLAPFYQDFMKSLDEHINELVEGIVLQIIFKEKKVFSIRQFKYREV